MSNLIKMRSYCFWCNCEYFEEDSDANRHEKFCCREHELEEENFPEG